MSNINTNTIVVLGLVSKLCYNCTISFNSEAISDRKNIIMGFALTIFKRICIVLFVRTVHLY